MLKYHLFLSSGIPKHNGYQGSFETVEAAESTLPMMNFTVTESMQASLYEAQEDGRLSMIRFYLRDIHFHNEGHWKAKRHDAGNEGRGYNVVGKHDAP